MHEVTKLHSCDTTTSNDEFSSYTHSIKLIPTTSTTHPVTNDTQHLYSKGATLSNFYRGRKTDNHETDFHCSSIFHQPFYLPRMYERYTLTPTSFPSQSFDETGCDYFLFPTPGKKDHVTVDIHNSLEHHTGIHSEEVDLLDFKVSNDLPSWYPVFQLPYQINVKVTCTSSHVYVEIIYIDVSPNPEIFRPYIYHEPSNEFIRCLFGIPSKENYVSDY